MGSLLDALGALADAGAAQDAMIVFAVGELGGGPHLSDELRDVDAAIAAGQQAEEQAEAEVQALARGWPQAERVVLHRPDLDPRALAVLGTLAYARRAGLYLPSELRRLAERDQISPLSRARESIRFRVWLTLAAFERGHLFRQELTPGEYAVRLVDLAERLARVQMPSV